MAIPFKALALGLAVTLPILSTPVQAHRSWLLPSATVLSGNTPWITVDAAVSTDVFYFEHNPLRLDGLLVLTPSGALGKVANQATGKYRSSFDVELAQPGTWKLAALATGLMASWEEKGERKRWRGSPDAFASEVPAQAEKLEVIQTASRVETFVTAGKPSHAVLQPTGKGLELVPLTHPNDLVAAEPARFRLVLDGMPVAGLKVAVVPGGKRYRDQLGGVEVLSDAQGEFSVTWPAAGLYWLSATVQDAKGQAPAVQRRVSYAATLEVLAP